MPSAAKVAPVHPVPHPRILVVDDEPAMLEMLQDVLGSLSCTVSRAASIAEARRVISKEPVSVLLVDVRLPDGDGLSLLQALKRHHPLARAIVITGDPCLDSATSALRQGAVDFVAKPFNAVAIVKQVQAALGISEQLARQEQKLVKLKSAVKKLNAARKTIGQKVDILCNDLVSAYGELSKQFDVVRTQEAFRKTVEQAADLEQLICHSMDWLMRQVGYSNVAVWLAGEDGGYQLGAYMKYTLPGDPGVSEALRRVVLPVATRDGRDTPVRINVADLKDKLSPAEQDMFKNQEFLAIESTYLGESLAALIFFRDETVPFSETDAETLRAISSVFATNLATIVRQTPSEDAIDSGEMEDGSSPGGTAKPKSQKPSKPDPADWWKRGELPPF